MVPEFKNIRADALKAETRILSEIDGLNNDLKTKKDNLAKARRILKEFPEEETAKSSAGKAEVIETAIVVLTENRPQAIPLEDLKSLVQERLKKQGFALVGTFRFFEKYLQEADAITKTENGCYGLAGSESPDPAGVR